MSTPTRRSGSPKGSGGNVFSRLFGAVGLFIRQIIDELRKVVRPTGPELVRYTTVVILFVSLMMLFAGVLDLVFNKAITWLFGG